MPQTQKPEVRDRILAAASDEFYDHGFDGATLAGIARRAGTATANIYRYVPDKVALFEAVITDEFVAHLDDLIARRVAALTEPLDAAPAADELLGFWLTHRRQVATLLDHTGPTRRGAYPQHFVTQLVDHLEASAPRPLSAHERALAALVFDNTRRAIVAMLRLDLDDDATRHLIGGFWSYQLPGLDGLRAWIAEAGEPSPHGR
ncbi:MAG TPA: helix-turn-helix domain-containing protein [Acidimicrobiales bacterium]|nr:helix-turn-helix domain-containing protein [Acidimicrobiales bacterium]